MVQQNVRCEECEIGKERSAAWEPMTKVEVLLALGAAISVVIIGLALRNQGNVWLGSQMPVQALGGMVWPVGWLLLLIDVGASLVALYFFLTRNVIGHCVYDTLTNGGIWHRHTFNPRVYPYDNQEYRAVLVRNRIGGWFRRSKVLETKGNDEFRVTSWTGEDMTVILKKGKFTVNVGTAMMFLRYGYPNAEVLIRRSLLVPPFLTELEVLRRVTSFDDPLNHGRSLHGQFVHERISSVLEQVPKYEFVGIASDVNQLVRELPRR